MKDCRIVTMMMAILLSASAYAGTKIVWKKGVDLIEYSKSYGAMADVFRLKRQK